MMSYNPNVDTSPQHDSIKQRYAGNDNQFNPQGMDGGMFQGQAQMGQMMGGGGGGNQGQQQGQGGGGVDINMIWQQKEQEKMQQQQQHRQAQQMEMILREQNNKINQLEELVQKAKSKDKDSVKSSDSYKIKNACKTINKKLKENNDENSYDSDNSDNSNYGNESDAENLKLESSINKCNSCYNDNIFRKPCIKMYIIEAILVILIYLIISQDFIKNKIKYLFRFTDNDFLVSVLTSLICGIMYVVLKIIFSYIV